MLRGFIMQYFERNLTLSDEGDQGSQLRIAAAALMLEVARADFHYDETEMHHIRNLLRDSLQLQDRALDELVELARSESESATSLHEFTSLIHAEYNLQQKSALFEQLWVVAFADGNLDKYEESLLRKIADLLYLPHQQFIQSKHAAMQRLAL